MTKEYPLQWPAAWPRSKARKAGKFLNGPNRITFYAAEQRAKRELGLLCGVREPIISTNMIRDRQPADCGVALYFQERDKPMRVIAIDIYDRVEDNLAAIAATIEAMRAIQRHGGATILERAFTGFDALPAPRDCFAKLGLKPGASPADINAAFRLLAAEHHPDRAGGSQERMSEITAARDDALKATALT